MPKSTHRTAGRRAVSTPRPMRKSQSPLQAAGDMVADAYDETSRRVGRSLEYGYRHPGQMSLVALGAGIGLGLLVAGAARRRSGISHALGEAIGALTSHMLHG
jgi:hypothetical protein